MTAQLVIMGRVGGQMRFAFWLTVVNCAAMYFHQMWKKWLHLRVQFVGSAAVLTMIVVHSGKFAGILFTIGFMLSNFLVPHFNRFRPRPKTPKHTTGSWTYANSPTVTPMAFSTKGRRHPNTPYQSRIARHIASLERSGTEGSLLRQCSLKFTAGMSTTTGGSFTGLSTTGGSMKSLRKGSFKNLRLGTSSCSLFRQDSVHSVHRLGSVASLSSVGEVSTPAALVRAPRGLRAMSQSFATPKKEEVGESA